MNLSVRTYCFKNLLFAIWHLLQLTQTSLRHHINHTESQLTFPGSALDVLQYNKEHVYVYREVQMVLIWRLAKFLNFTESSRHGGLSQWISIVKVGNT